MKHFFCALTALALMTGSLALAECPRFSEAEYPIVDGSTATLPLSRALYSASTGADETTAELAVSHSKTTQAFYQLLYGSADLLLVYEPAPEALQAFEAEGVEYEMEPIGKDALVFLINSENPVESLTQDQLVGIYSGEITNWSEVGGEDKEIIAYTRNESSGSQVMMEALCMKDTPMAEGPQTYQISEMEGLIREVASYRNTADAIGYSVYYYARNMYTEEGVKLAAVDGAEPSNQTIADGSYPYTQDFYAVIRADAPEGSPQRQLFDWLVTDEGRQLITDAGYVASLPENS